MRAQSIDTSLINDRYLYPRRRVNKGHKLVVVERLAMALEAIRYDGQRLEILNQLLLPSQSVYEEIKTVHDAWTAIHTMKVCFIVHVTLCILKYRHV